MLLCATLPVSSFLTSFCLPSFFVNNELINHCLSLPGEYHEEEEMWIDIGLPPPPSDLVDVTLVQWRRVNDTNTATFINLTWSYPIPYLGMLVLCYYAFILLCTYTTIHLYYYVLSTLVPFSFMDLIIRIST